MENGYTERAKAGLQLAALYVRSIGKWLVLAVAVGLVCGVIGTAFHVGVHEATLLRGEHPWLLWCLPLAGLVIVGFYKLTKTEGQGTNAVIDEVHLGKGLPILLLPAIFLGTVLTHLCGGSAGREGAALQMGGTIGFHTGRLFRLDDKDLRIATLAGMAAFFSALFGTPLTAALTAYGVSLLLGVEPTRFTVEMPALAAGTMLRVGVLAVLCALVSVLFCGVMHTAEHLMDRYFPNAWMRVAAGGFAVIALTYLCGTTDYNGAGMEVVTAAVEQGTAHPAAFLLKLLFTAVTLAAGFKGGEVVPSFFVGAAFGCVAAQALGLPGGFGAAIGLIAVFCGAVNCPIASVLLSIELFGGSGGVLYFAFACAISYVLSGYCGLYSSQTILYSKLRAEFINVHAKE